MSGQPTAGQSRGELETARALNTVATIGAGHALWTSLPEASRKKATGKVVPKAVARRAAKVRAAVRVPKGAGRKAALATTGGWLGFHGAELAGDVMARRSINQQLNAKKVEKMDPIIEQSYVSKAETAPVTGMGTNLDVEKRYYDSEADRQRRIGAAAGILGGTSIVTGAAAGRGVKVERGVLQMKDGSAKAGVQAGFAIPKGKSPAKAVRTKAGLAAASAVTGVGALAAYKRGVSRRNQTWQ